MVHDVQPPPNPLWYCMTSTFYIFFCFLCSTLLIVSMTFDRFYSIIMPHKAASFNTVRRTKITIACIVIISLLYSVPHMFVTSYGNWDCVPYGSAIEISDGQFYYWLSFLIQFALPFILLLIMNSFIIHKLRTRTVLSNEKAKGISIKPSRPVDNPKTKSSDLQVFAILLLVTFAFLILTTPAYVFLIFVKFVDFAKTPPRFAGYFLFYNIAHKMQFTNHGINFFLYVISGKKFKTDLRN